MNIIDTIRVSGTDYTLSATSSGGASAVEVTQAEYDALVSGGTVDPNTFYIITDAQAGDLTQYWTSAQTNSAITEATSGKVDTSTFNTYSGNVETALSGKQDTLSAGTGIDITDNVISATGGGGGGKAVSGGTNISITTGETADTINCTLPCYRDSGNMWTLFGYSSSLYSNNSTNADDSVYIGYNNEIKNTNISYKTYKNIIIGWGNKLDSRYDGFGQGYNVIIGEYNTLSGSNNIRESYVIGRYNKGYASDEFICGWLNEARNRYETSFGHYNNSVSASTTFGDSGNTLFSVGNGTADNARHNAFEIRQNGDIYITLNGQDVKLQDNLGGGGGSITIDPSLDSGSTNAVANSAITTAIDAKANKGVFSEISVTSMNGHPGVKFNKDNGEFNVLWLSRINGTRVFETGSLYTQAQDFSLVETSAITTTITSSSTDAQVPSAKAVYDTIGNINTILESI